MGFLDIFIVREEGNQQEVKQNVNNEQHKVANISSQTTPSVVTNNNIVQPQNIVPETNSTYTPSVQNVSTTDINTNILEMLQQKIIDSDLPEPDYVEFKKEVKKASRFTKDENVQFSGALTNLNEEYSDASKDRILSSIEHYIKIIEGERDLGLSECEAKRKEKITNRESHLTSLNDQINIYKSKIEELQNLMASTQEEINKTKQEINQSTMEIDNEEKIFMNSINYMINLLNSDKTKIQNI